MKEKPIPYDVASCLRASFDVPENAVVIFFDSNPGMNNLPQIVIFVAVPPKELRIRGILYRFFFFLFDIILLAREYLVLREGILERRAKKLRVLVFHLLNCKRKNIIYQ